MRTLRENFNTSYEIVHATTEELLKESQRLRYQVFCSEKPIFEKEKFKEGLERDDFDSRSVHSFIRDRKTGLAVASVRLVLADPQDENASFPLEKYCGNLLPVESEGLGSFARMALGEISRFAISKNNSRTGKESGKYIERRGTLEEWGTELRRRVMEGRTCADRSFHNNLTLGLIRALIQMGAEKKISRIYACMEPALQRLLERYGVFLKPLGPAVNYFGKRRPCFALVDELLETVLHERPDIWDFITDGGRLWSLATVHTAR